jgi:hypothetical protein
MIHEPVSPQPLGTPGLDLETWETTNLNNLVLTNQ